MARQFLHKQLFPVLMVGRPLPLPPVLVLMARWSLLLLQQSPVAGRRWWSAGVKAGRPFGFSASNFLSIAVAMLSGSGKSVQGPAGLISLSCSSFEDDLTAYCIAISVAEY